MKSRRTRVGYGDKEYPILLKTIDGRPNQLYMEYEDGCPLGKIFAMPAVAVVGTRKITEYGKKVTSEIVTGLVGSGVVIVSGLMYGLDEVAHRAALATGGLTIGVWAGGIDTLRGTSREFLAEKILGGGGVIISEIPWGIIPKAEYFPPRNRIISGLSLATVVVEAGVDSGSLITAGYAADQGREVFAVPGPVTSPQSLGTAKLIQKGAMLVTSAQDILETLGII